MIAFTLSMLLFGIPSYFLSKWVASAGQRLYGNWGAVTAVALTQLVYCSVVSLLCFAVFLTLGFGLATAGDQAGLGAGHLIRLFLWFFGILGALFGPLCAIAAAKASFLYGALYILAMPLRKDLGTASLHHSLTWATATTTGGLFAIFCLCLTFGM